MKILFFGALTDITQTTAMTLDGIADTDALEGVLQQQFPALLHSTYFLAVNLQMIRQNTVLNNEDEVALMPPFSGG